MKFRGCSANRSKLEIKYDIICNLTEEITISELLFISNTNYVIAIPIIKELKEKKIISERKLGRRRLFVLTKLGFKVKKELNSMFKEYLL